MEQIAACSVALTLAFMLTGCATLGSNQEFVETEIAVFHQLDVKPSATTFAFEPLLGQEGDLEYAAYKEMVRTQLTRHGFQDAGADALPEVVVSFSYSIDGGNDAMDCVPLDDRGGLLMPMNDAADISLRTTGIESGGPAYTPVCDPAQSAMALRTRYTRYLMVDIIDASTIEQGPLKVLYEGSAKSRGPSSQLARVMPGMIEALFRDFPGESGVARVERIEIRPELVSTTRPEVN